MRFQLANVRFTTLSRSWLATPRGIGETSMNTYIALFRGINVGGSHLLPMKDLKLMLEQNGLC